MKQSRRMSVVESLANVAVGYAIAVLTQIAVFPIFGLRVSLTDNMIIGLVFTIVSIVRSFVLRRVFEEVRVRAERKSAARL